MKKIAVLLLLLVLLSGCRKPQEVYYSTREPETTEAPQTIPAETATAATEATEEVTPIETPIIPFG